MSDFASQLAEIKRGRSTYWSVGAAREVGARRALRIKAALIRRRRIASRHTVLLNKMRQFSSSGTSGVLIGISPD